MGRRAGGAIVGPCARRVSSTPRRARMKGGTRTAAAIDASPSSRKLPPKMPWQRSAPSGIKSSPSDADDLLALGLTVLYALLLLRVLFALGRLLWKVRSAQTADARRHRTAA